MAEYTKKELSFDELEQVAGGGPYLLNGEQQSSLFMQDSTVSNLTAEASSKIITIHR